jgi:hypothetical protein
VRLSVYEREKNERRADRQSKRKRKKEKERECVCVRKRREGYIFISSLMRERRGI